MRFFYPILFVIFLLSCNKTPEQKGKIAFTPIGYLHSNFTLKTGAPRQSLLAPDTKGYIVLDTIYRKALKDLNRFEYIWVISYFDKVKGWDSIISPPKSNHRFGLFATRSPRRPNPIGLSLVKLDTIIADTLFLSGIDLFDGTPILDIKPFLPSVDYVVSEKNMITEYQLGHHNENYIADSLVEEFVLGKK